MIRLIFSATLLGPALAQAIEIKAESETAYKKMDEASVHILKKEDSLKIEGGDQVLFMGENRVPVLVIAPTQMNSTLTLSDFQQEQLLQDATKKKVNAAVSEIVTKLMNLENMIRGRNFTGAQNMIEDLKTKFPHVAAIYFASGTTHFLMNKKSLAATDLEKGLELEPDNVEAKKLLQRIKGGS